MKELLMIDMYYVFFISNIIEKTSIIKVDK
jgi:hypothetical protein